MMTKGMGSSAKASPLPFMLNTAKVILFLSPLAYMSGRSLDGFDCVVFHASFCLLIIAFLFYQPIKAVSTLKPFAVFLLACLISTALNGFNVISSVCLLNASMAAVITFILCFVGDYRQFTNVFIIATGVNVALSALSSIGFSPIIQNPGGEAGGMFGNAPRLCYYLAITMPFVVERFRCSVVFYAICGLLFKELYLFAFAFILTLKHFYLFRWQIIY